MKSVTSKDGTQIAYEKIGQGPALILVDGALCYRAFGPMGELSKLVSPHYTVTLYDRRGRGESRDSKSYALQREIEDLEALTDEAGGTAFLYGLSSGACLTLEAAVQLGRKVRKLAIYEAPYLSGDEASRVWEEYRRKLDELLSSGRRGDAVALFMQFVGTPADQVAGMRQGPVWSMFEAVAPTLPYDAAAIGEDRSAPLKRIARIGVPVLVMNGTGLPFMAETARALAKAIPHAEQRTLEGQGHNVDLKVLAPRLIEFFA